MKEFSKEYVEKHHSGSKYDFVLEDIFDAMPKDCMIPTTCNGFGSSAIMKDTLGKCYLGFYISSHLTTPNRDFFYWHPMDFLLKQDINDPLFGPDVIVQIN